MEIENKPGMYVVSFNMEKPMVYWRARPWSNNYVDNSMIKVGKAKNLRSRMNSYKLTFGYRKSEPPRTLDYWLSKGYKDINLRKCFGCDLTEPHHHVNFEYIREADFMTEENRVAIEKKIREQFSHAKVFREYFKKEIKDELIEFLDSEINSYKN